LVKPTASHSPFVAKFDPSSMELTLEV